MEPEEIGLGLCEDDVMCCIHAICMRSNGVVSLNSSVNEYIRYRMKCIIEVITVVRILV